MSNKSVMKNGCLYYKKTLLKNWKIVLHRLMTVKATTFLFLNYDNAECGRRRDLLEAWLKKNAVDYCRDNEGNIRLLPNFLPTTLDNNTAVVAKSSEPIQEPSKASPKEPEAISLAQELQNIRENMFVERRKLDDDSKLTWTEKDQEWLETNKKVVIDAFKEDAQSPLCTTYAASVYHGNAHRHVKLLEWLRSVGFVRCSIYPHTFATSTNNRMAVTCPVPNLPPQLTTN